MSHLGFEKAISPWNLMQLLSKLPENSILTINLVGNIRISDRETGRYLGYIDLGEETIKIFEN